MNTALEKTDSANGLAIVPSDVSASALQCALAGDLSQMRADERLKFYGKLCEFTGLNPLAKPFDWLTFQGKLTLYANKGCAEQLRKIHGVSVDIIERTVQHGCMVVRVRAVDRDGRHDEALAALPFAENMAADAKAMAMMKCETKAKRRATFSICGLSLVLDREDEATERTGRVAVASIDGAETARDEADKLNRMLTGGQKETAIAVEVVPEPVRPTVVAPPEVVIMPPPAEESFPGAPAESQIENLKAQTGAPAAGPQTEAERLLMEFETVISQHPKSGQYLVFSKKLQPGQHLSEIDPAFMKRVIAQSASFLKAVETWAQATAKPAAR